MWNFFKWSFRLLIGALLLTAILYGAFHIWEYATGGPFVKYLSKNSETIPIEENFTYETMGKDVAKNQLILLGEIHGFDEPVKLDVDFFKYLHENHDVDHYVVEADFVQASKLNEFLKSGDEQLLSDALRKWVVIQGQNNKDYFDKYRAFHKYYVGLPEDDKFEFIGIDFIRDGDLMREFLDTLSPERISDSEEGKESLGELVDGLFEFYNDSPDTLFILSHLKFNLESSRAKMGREELMFQNFRALYNQYGLHDKRLYGFFGIAHVFQYRINGKHPLASKIRMSDLGLNGKILSINIMMNDSYMVMPSNQLPSFMSNDGPYTKMPVSADNMLFLYLVGIKDFKRMTPEHHKSLIKMNASDTPYSNTVRMEKAIQLLPVTEKMKMTDAGQPYIQYTIFVRNSDWAEPMN